MEYFAHRARRRVKCEACPECTNSYDRWYYLFAGVVQTLRKTFEGRHDKTALQVLDKVLSHYWLDPNSLTGMTLGILPLHPSGAITEILRARANEPEAFAIPRGRPRAISQQAIDRKVFQEAWRYVDLLRRQKRHNGWFGLAKRCHDSWFILMSQLSDLQNISPRVIRQKEPPVGAIQQWMDGFDDESGLAAMRDSLRHPKLTTKRLAYRLATYLRYDPERVLAGEGARGTESLRDRQITERLAVYVLQNEPIIRRRINRALQRNPVQLTSNPRWSNERDQ